MCKPTIGEKAHCIKGLNSYHLGTCVQLTLKLIPKLPLIVQTVNTILEGYWDVPQQPVKFLYLVQTESCLSACLQGVIDDPSICPCDGHMHH